MAENLAISIRAFAGALSQSPIIINFIDDVDRAFADSLRRLGAEIRVAARVEGSNPLANKLRMLELHEGRDFDVLIALDCDVVVLGDPGPWIDPAGVGAKAADFDRLTDQEWHALFAAVGLGELEKTLTATVTGQPLYPYFNSGVLFVPREICRPLRDAWMSTYNEVSEVLRRNPEKIREQWHWLAEQASLGLGMVRADLPWRALPAELNFPSHVNVPAMTTTSRPVIVHYHADRDAYGFLMRSRNAEVNPWLDRFNRRRAEVMGQAYSGLPRRAVTQCARQAASRKLWEFVGERAWYRSGRARRVRKAIKSLVKGKGQRGNN